MELNRRNFIKLAVGGVAGIHITPLPWKLTDDLAIWTQNWPWVPVPSEGRFSTAKSICQLCPGGCGIEVRKAGDRAVKIEGRTDFPVNPGGICPVGAGGLQLLYNDSIRFRGPMKRAGLRGSDTFVDITWEEALNILSTRLTALRNQGAPEAVAAVNGYPYGSTSGLMVERFMTAYGSPNCLRTPSLESTYAMGGLLMQGTEGPMGFDLENSDYVLSFGAGLLEGWGSPGRIMNAWGLWQAGNPAKRKTQVVQVESRASNTASKAHQWVAIKPGTDAALALSIAHVLVKDGLLDMAFIDQYCFGFHDWTSPEGLAHKGFKTMVLKDYSPERVSQITGVASKVIVSIAKGFAKAKAPVAIYGKGKDFNGSLYEFMAVHSLNALRGRINKPGGVVFANPLPLGALPDVGKDAAAEKGLRTPRLDQAGTPRFPFSPSLIQNFTEAVLGSSESVVDTLLVFSANPAFTLPDGGNFREVLKRTPFIVSFSPYRDETSVMADLILPDHTYLEKVDDVVWPLGLQYPLYGLTKAAVSPVNKTKNIGDTLLLLAHKMDGVIKAAFPWKSYEEVLKERAKGLLTAGAGAVRYEATGKPPWLAKGAAGSTKSDYSSFDDLWKKLQAGGLWYQPLSLEKGVEGVFQTPSKKFEFFSVYLYQAVSDYAKQGSMEKALKGMGLVAKGDEVYMPHYSEPPAVDRKTYPLDMVPYEMINLSSNWIASPPFLYKTLFDHQLLKDKSFASLNPKTAAQCGLKEGDLIRVQSPAGSVEVRVHLFEGACPGMVYLPLGFGHTGYDEFQKNKGANPNDIIVARKDPVSGHPVWWNTPVRIIKV